MLSILELRSLIINALGNHLGYYFLPGADFPSPALAVIPDISYGYNYPPEDTVISGVEAVIVRVKPRGKPLLGNDSLRTLKYEIHLKQWDNNGDLFTCSEALLNAFQAAQLLYTEWTYVDPDLDAGIIPSCVCSVKEVYVKTDGI